MKRQPGYLSWGQTKYPKGTKVYVFSADKKKVYKGIGTLMSNFPSAVTIIEFNGDVLFSGDDVLWIPVDEMKGKEKVIMKLKEIASKLKPNSY